MSKGLIEIYNDRIRQLKYHLEMIQIRHQRPRDQRYGTSTTERCETAFKQDDRYREQILEYVKENII